MELVPYSEEFTEINYHWRLREHYILNGKPADNYLYSLLKGEFTY